MYAEKEYGVGGNKAINKTRLQAEGYIFSEDIIRHTVSGETSTLEFNSSDMNSISVNEKLNTKKHGRDYHQKIGKIGLEIGMTYSFMNTIIRKLFDKNFNYSRKILALESREVYAFVLNNADRLKHFIREAMAYELAQFKLDVKSISENEFRIPQSCLFTYNGDLKTQIEYKRMFIKDIYHLLHLDQLRNLNLKNSVNVPKRLNGGIKMVIKVTSIFLLFMSITPKSKNCFIPTILFV